MVFGIIPECRSVSLRNKRSASPESPAVSAAGTTTKSLFTAVTISLGVALMLIIFFWLEFEQVRLSRLFGDRAKRLESAFRRLSPNLPIRVPYIANEIALSSYQETTSALRKHPRPRIASRW